VDHGARIVNLSLTSNGSCTAGGMQSVVNYALQKNVLLVVAAGNENMSTTSRIPSNCSGVLTVGATDTNDKRASFSNYGTAVKISAPGVNILSTKAAQCSSIMCRTIVGSNYALSSGTSMSTPHVAGVAALLIAANNALTPQQLISCIVNGGDPITTDQPIGGKRLNATKALSLCGASTPTSTPTISTTLSPTPTSAAGTKSFAITLCPHGIGKCGDNVNANSMGTTSPKHTQRMITLTILDASRQTLVTKSGGIAYNQTAQNYQGAATNISLNTGQYLAKMHMDGCLIKLYPGMVTVGSGSTVTLPLLPLTCADVNNDNKLDILDYNLILNCYGSKQTTSACAIPPTSTALGADITDDGVVDQFDYNFFMREFSTQMGQ
jgi:hypothetical protein